MPKITLYLKEAQIRSEVSGILTSGMAGVEVNLVCDASWEGLYKTLVCRGGDIAKTVLIQNDRAVVAHEAMVAGKWLELGVEGRNEDGSVVVPTLWERCCIVLPGVDADVDSTVDPTLPVWMQLQKRVEALEIPPIPSEIGAIPAPIAAEVGQYFQVSAVNGIGAVVAVEAVDAPSGGESYKLPAATADALGGIKADSATDGDTQPVRIGADGNLYTAPGGDEVWETILDYTVQEECSQVLLTTDMDGNPFSLKRAIAVCLIYPLAEPTSWPLRCVFDAERTAVYSSQHFWNGIPTTSATAGKCVGFKLDVCKTNEGLSVVNAQSITGGTADVKEEGDYTMGPSSMYNRYYYGTLSPVATGINAFGVGSYKTAIGVGSRIKLLGVRE